MGMMGEHYIDPHWLFDDNVEAVSEHDIGTDDE